ncbi:MAG: TolC family outer membrane protein [Alphaproteobacteria bacterium]|nr:TolC family outer membrane protein [Alphaproteobacteria bacterium]
MGKALQRALGTGAFLFLAAAPLTAAGQTLTEALATAYQNNPTLQAQRAQLRAVDEAVPQATAGWRPTITLNAEAGRNRNEGNLFAQSSGAQNRSPSSVNLQVSQPLFRGGRTIYETRRAENRVQAERARLRVVEAETLLDAATAFMDVLRDQAVVELSVNNEQVLRRQLEAAVSRFEVGEITRTDVAQAEARLAGARAARIRAEGDLASSRAAFKTVIGVAPQQLIAPPGPGNLPEVRETALQRAANYYPGVIAAAFDEKAARETVNAVEGELLPTVSLNGEVSRAREQFSSADDTERAEITAQLTVPLYQAGAVHSRLREARQVAGQRQVEVDKARREAIEQSALAWSDLEAARASIVSLESQIGASTIALEGVNQEALVGSRTVLDVLDAEQELLDAKVALVQAKRDAFVAGFRLKSAMGVLTAEALSLPVQPYDMNEHYNAVRDKWIGLGDDPE